MTQTEGYLVLALDDPRYLDLAANVALSVRRAGTRAVSVVINRAIPWNDSYDGLFEHVISTDDPRVRGAMNKLALFDLTPYDRTLYLDADCLLFSSKIEFFWRRYRNEAFAVEGHRQSDGTAFACSVGERDAAKLCRLLDIAYLAVFNAGVIYFERTPSARSVFETARNLYAGPLRDEISYRYKHEGEYADEPFFAAALAMHGIAPFEPPPLQRLQVTTPNFIDGVLDLDTGDLRVVKQLGGGKPRLWSGVVCHFCGLAPMDRYFPLADKLRHEAGLKPMDRASFNPVVLNATHHKEPDAVA